MNQLGWSGTWDVYRNGKHVKQIKNKITDAGLAWLLGLIHGDVGSIPGIKYMALGTNSLPTENDQQLLGNELIRRPIDVRSIVSGRLESTVAFLDDEANFQIREIGIFASVTGNEATELKDTGVLIARAVATIDKNESQPSSLTLKRTDRLVRI